ncbi:hypothetical protein L7F22_025803 [Adiantum nelumboides]|nr:hypothetical protein [Adiantum nelumboides]
MTTVQKIKEIEDEIAKTQKNKATSYHLGQLRSKLAKLQRELISPSTSGGRGGTGFRCGTDGHCECRLHWVSQCGKEYINVGLDRDDVRGGRIRVHDAHDGARYTGYSRRQVADSRLARYY